MDATKLHYKFELVQFVQLTVAVMGTNIHGILIYEWVLKFSEWMLTVTISTCINGVLVIDGYLCSRVYGIW